MQSDWQLHLKSEVPGIVWPALVSGMPATLLALLQQLETTQSWCSEKILAAQPRQLHTLVPYAQQHSPHFAQRMASAGLTVADLMNPAGFAALPLLKRADIQADAALLRCDTLPTP